LYFRIGLRARAANEYASIALIYLEKDNLDKAKEFFDKAFEYDPGNVSALIGLSKLALKSDNQDEAFDSLDTALSQDPNNKEVLLTYAKLAIDSDRIEDAQRALALLIDIDPLNVETKKLLATFHLKEDRFENAWEELLPVIDDALDDEKWSDAQELLQHFIEHYPVPVRQRLLRICRAQGDDTAIASELKELAALHEIEGSKQDALQLYKEALERNPDDSISAEKIKDLEVHEETAQPAIEPSSENQMAPEENTVSIPEHNEVSFPEMETVNEIHIDTGENAADTVEEKIKLDDSLFATAEPENENMSHPDETTPAHIPEIELNNITSPEQRETISLPQGPQALSDEEFAEQKSEADFYMQQGLEDEAVEIYKRLAAARPDDSEITNKLASLRPGSTEHADNPVKKSDEKQISHDSVDDDLTALFARLDEPEAEKIDYEARYTAGLEFKQKGLLDEAIKELQVAAKDPEKKQRNATMLALCYMEKGSYPLAIAEFNKVVDSMSPSASTYLHVKYELANAHLKNKDYARPLELFSEVHGKDPDFKDVSARLDALKAQQSPAPEGTPKPKRDRVSYI
jgi:tetratricopeptide (TPR) repeat protein